MSAVWVDQESGWTTRAGVASHIGHYRENNEDFVYLDQTYPFALVLDGMGGQAAGELASQKGAEVVQQTLRSGLESGQEPRPLIEQALHAGNEAVLALGRSNREFQNCGTTIVLTVFHRGAVHVSWLGDSSAFRISGGRIEKLTWEHDLRNALVRQGTISAEEARNSRIRNVLWRYLGNKEAEGQFEVPSFTPYHGDRLLLATDGITGVLPDADILQHCQSHPDPLVCAEELVNLALERGSRDNCTCAVIAFEGADGGPAPEPPQPPSPTRKWWRFWK